METWDPTDKKEQGRFCVNHPERKAFAVCMHCGKVMCQECATQWDGINYCANCLSAQRAMMVKKASLTGWLSMVVILAALFTLLGYITVWAGCILADML